MIVNMKNAEMQKVSCEMKNIAGVPLKVQLL